MAVSWRMAWARTWRAGGFPVCSTPSAGRGVAWGGGMWNMGQADTGCEMQDAGYGIEGCEVWDLGWTDTAWRDVRYGE